MKMIKFSLLLFSIFLIYGCPDQSDPPPECGSPFYCLKVINVNSGNTCCSNTPKTAIVNENPSKNIYAEIFEDTLLSNNWLYSTSYLKKIPKNSQIEMGCGYRTKIVSGDPVCYLYKRWRIMNACFEGNDNCDFKLPDNSDLKLIDCRNNCSTCNEMKFSQLNSQQRRAIWKFYQDLLNSETQTAIYNDDFLAAFFPNGHTSKERQTILSNNDLQSTGNSYHLQPLLPSPINFLNTNETFQKIWVDCPNVVSGQISRSPSEVKVSFTSNAPELVTVQVKLEPSNTIRTDVIKNLYLIKAERRIILSGDFICFNISGINNDK
ncbi:MAG: hypothetical protein J7578_24005 [Chitinophagaceae bacterium]|nr:hypothetical protein [Chitinophagaceae bacterium]